jgi:hypothetical protein
MGYMRDTWEEYKNLAPGEYYMYVEFDWPKTSEHTEFCVSYYGYANAYFLRDESSLYEKDALITELMASAAESGNAKELKPQDPNRPDSFAARGAPKLQKYFGVVEEGYVVTHYVNNEVEAELTETVSFTKFDRLSVLKPHKGTGYSITLKPGEKKTIVYRQDDYTGFQYQC